MEEAGRVEDVTESVIRKMTRKAKRYDAINLSQGYPDYPAHEDVLEGAKSAIDAKMNQYSITWGKEKLRKKIAEKLKRFNDVGYDPEFEITVTCGSSEAIMSTMLGLIEKGDPVLIFQPYYENYVPSVQMASGKPRFTEISKDQRIDKEDIKEKVDRSTKAMILNTPHNPTGKVFSRDDLEFIRDICLDKDVLAVTDEMYERMVYDGEHVSLASLEGMWDRTVTIGGFSKIYSITGWRVGYAAAPKELMTPIRKAHDYTTVCAPTPFQEGAVEALALPDKYYSQMLEYYKRARDLVYEALKKTRMDPYKPQGAYYMLADLDRYDMDDLEFADHLVKDKGVAVVSGSSFYDEGGNDVVRFCFSQEKELLEEAMRRINE